MRLDSLSKHFESMGGRVRFGEVELPERLRSEPKTLRQERFRRQRERRLPAFTIDISDDKKGEYFDIRIRKGRDIGFRVLQSLPKQRHLLMMTSRGRRFLCGHDERHWFVTEIRKPVSTVRDAWRALLPPTMQGVSRSIRTADLKSRKNDIFRRQGEWFFIPVDKEFDESVIHRDEPIQRNAGSKAHVCEMLVREGGETVYILGRKVFKQRHYQFLAAVHRRRAQPMRMNARVFACGYVRHPDHRTIHLDSWHEVLLNDERSSRNVVFLD